jgi:predicted transcriptional regulator
MTLCNSAKVKESGTLWILHHFAWYTYSREVRCLDTQNITLSLPKEILRKIKIIAVQKDTSVSGLLTDALAELVRREDAYVQAREHHIASLRQAADLGTKGQMGVAREDLHDRRG